MAQTYHLQRQQDRRLYLFSSFKIYATSILKHKASQSETSIEQNAT